MLRETSVICPGERVCGCTIDCAGDFVLIAFGPRCTFRNITVPMVFFECLSVSSVSFLQHGAAATVGAAAQRASSCLQSRGG